MVFFAVENDVQILLDQLNEDPELAFVVRGEVIRTHPATLIRVTATPLKVHTRVTFHAFPSALERLHRGIDHYAFNWNLGPALKSARP